MGRHVPTSALAANDTGTYDTAQAAAIAGLRSITDKTSELGGGVLFNPQTNKFAYTQPVGQGKGYHFGAGVQVPPGWHLQALYHTHPPGSDSTVFSGDDVNMAKQLKVQSYILPHDDDKIRLFDPTNHGAASRVDEDRLGGVMQQYANGVVVDEPPPPKPASSQPVSSTPVAQSYQSVGTPVADPYAAIASPAAAQPATSPNP